MKQKSPEEQKVILDRIKTLRIEEELILVQDNGKSQQYVFFVLVQIILIPNSNWSLTNFI